jgi:hypothetical protein
MKKKERRDDEEKGKKKKIKAEKIGKLKFKAY